jgi:hypothetical protein
VKTRFFKAYATTELNDGPRTLIDAERIVIVLGEDCEGRPLEISIRLADYAKSPPEVQVFAIVEPTPKPLPGTYMPHLVIEKGPIANGGHISVWHENFSDIFKRGDEGTA